MFRNALGRLVATVAVVVGGVATAQPTFQLVTQLDTSALDIAAGFPGSIAAYGDDLYIGSLFSGGSVAHIENPLTSPLNVATLGGGGVPGNGYVSLHTDGTTLVAATNNAGGGEDLIQSFDIATGNLNWSQTETEIGQTRIDGAAVDPITGNIIVTAFGSADQTVLDPLTGLDASDNPSDFQAASPVSTGWRDIAFDRTTGDIYLRATGGVARGNRNPSGGSTDDYETPDPFEGPAGVQAIAVVSDDFQTAINVEFLPASFAGQNLIILGDRDTPAGMDSFDDHIKLFDADSLTASTTPVAATFLDSSGLPFAPADSANGIYDFSFDPVNELLYISDHQNALVYVFGQEVGPSGVDGDYNNDGRVDAADYTVWRDNFGQPVNLPNDVTEGTVDSGDLTVWRNNYGATATPSAIPEPTALALGLLAVAGVAARRR